MVTHENREHFRDRRFKLPLQGLEDQSAIQLIFEKRKWAPYVRLEAEKQAWQLVPSWSSKASPSIGCWSPMAEA